ncbi:GNAT family N-acetyltransferase [Aliiroseovarius sp. F47248L]|uniref:GNAT family N-acetyltransferase n=1 Tax=Aliiroseovarius sp. F47248L TaxID=2926420 RepID=UPI001FF4F291|nr:GNAT family N-acetyltransferase [Aliiroseovarius sp. F47248L]
MTDTQIEICTHQSISSIAARDWDACACPETSDGGRPVDPFTTHRFLTALETSASVGAGTGWHPHYLSVHADGQVIAVAPVYVKTHSQGEYVFDYSWADAYERAGGRYYPKLQVAVPFTPVTGRRFLTQTQYQTVGRAGLVQGLVQIAADKGLSSAHVTFCTDEEAQVGKQMGLLHRVGQQFHWENDSYQTFDAFLDSLSSRKRKQIRKERRQAQGFGGRIVTLNGDAIEPHHWDTFWRFYQDTGARKWGRPYLTRSFFDEMHQTMRDDVLLVLALEGDHAVAGALNIIGRDTLFGRYWGALEHHPCLHFELCYYQAIDFAISQGLLRVEAGAQGEHKLARGYLPVATHSLHWIAEPGFRNAVEQFVTAEKEAVEGDIDILTSYGPFRKTNIRERD